MLERRAADELRSVNGQIEKLLTEKARRSGRMPSRDELEERKRSA